MRAQVKSVAAADVDSVVVIVCGVASLREVLAIYRLKKALGSRMSPLRGERQGRYNVVTCSRPTQVNKRDIGRLHFLSPTRPDSAVLNAAHVTYYAHTVCCERESVWRSM